MSATRVQANPSSVSQKQAVDNAKAAFAKLPGGEALFQQCIDSNEPVHEIVESLYRKCGVHKRKKFTRVLTGFQRYTSWMNSIAGSIDVAVQASSGIACPVWAPIKFVLKVLVSGFHSSGGITDLDRCLKTTLKRQRKALPSSKRFRIIYPDSIYTSSCTTIPNFKLHLSTFSLTSLSLL